jgi:hypothetical protein
MKKARISFGLIVVASIMAGLFLNKGGLQELVTGTLILTILPTIVFGVAELIAVVIKKPVIVWPVMWGLWAMVTFVIGVMTLIPKIGG